MMEKDRLYQLISRHIAGQNDPGEERELLSLLADPAREMEIIAQLDEYWENLPTVHRLPEATAENLFRAILVATLPASVFPGAALPAGEDRVGDRRAIPILIRLAIAAVAALLIAAGTLLWIDGNHRPPVIAAQTHSPADIAPGGNKAVLTLSNGSKIILDSAAIGQLAQQGNTRVIKRQDGRIAYQPLASGPETGLYNTLSTPRGGQYRLTLADGTKVWLNAASSIRFPAAFSGGQRTVSITGEAYFEVARDPGRPFRVQAGGLDIAVLGTSFDIMAYPEEPENRASLVEGSIRVEKGGTGELLHPGWQARVDKSGSPDILIVHDADLREALAWKDGRFYFAHADLGTVLRQVARWYDVDIRYEGVIAPMEFGGEIARSSNLSQLLRILELSKIHFRVEGRTIIVRP